MGEERPREHAWTRREGALRARSCQGGFIWHVGCFVKVFYTIKYLIV